MSPTRLDVTDVTAAAASGCSPKPIATPPLDRADAAVAAVRLKAVADPVRLQLISLIRASVNGEACVCDLTEPVGLSQPTVSHHMKLLVDAGLATREQRGRWAYYRVVTDALEQASRTLRP